MRYLLLSVLLLSVSCSGGSAVDPFLTDTTADQPWRKPHDVSGDVASKQCESDDECDDDNPCTVDDCDWQGLCKNVSLTGSSCDDDNVCTEDEACSSEGKCVSDTMVNCDDADPCTDQWCDPVAGCLFDLAETGTFCDDENPCTENDGCEAGECGGTFMQCDSGNPCINSSCDLATGTCVDSPVSNLPCDDGNACTNGDLCMDGECISGDTVNCDDGDFCTLDNCFEAPVDQGGGCQHDPAVGLVCDDDNPCTEEDQCNEEAVCLGTKLDCDDGNQCTADLCNPALGCYQQELDGQACEDGDSCTAGDKCAQGACQPGGPKNCSDGVECTADYCAPDGQCGHVPTDILCDDGLACTNDKCDALAGCINYQNHGVCKDQKPCTKDVCDAVQGCTNQPQEGYYNGLLCCIADNLVCNDGNSCTVDSCNPVLNQCINNAIPDGYPCSDGLDCTQGESCQGGHCGCSDANLCTLDACDENGGCLHTPISCVPNEICWESVCNPYTGKCLAKSVDCDDGDPCTEDLCKLPDGCTSQPKDCVPEQPDPCVTYGCDPAQGGCFQQPLDCDDGSPCTLDDHCEPSTGLCISTSLDCDDEDPCTADWCDGPTGECLHSQPDCDDANVCTQDACQGEAGCVYTPAEGAVCWSHEQCDDEDPCTADECDVEQACVCSNPTLDPDDGDCCTIDSCDQESGVVHQLLYPGCLMCTGPDDCLVECPLLPNNTPVAPDFPALGLCKPDTQVVTEDGKTEVLRNLCSVFSCEMEEEQCGPGAGRCVGEEPQCIPIDSCHATCCDPDTGLMTTTMLPDCCDEITDPPGMESNPLFDPDKSACFDDDVCTIDWCDYETGLCQQKAVTCNDGDPCTVEACVPGEGCVSQQVPDCAFNCYNDYDCRGDHGYPLDEMGLCSTEQCSFALDPLGECIYQPLACDDGKPCTLDWCESKAGCLYLPGECAGVPCEVDSDCDDNAKCTTNFCLEGGCDSFIVGCSDDDPCTADWCNPYTGSCTSQPAEDCVTDCTLGGPDICDDGNECTADHCGTLVGECVHALVTCNDLDPCTFDYCVPESGCVFDLLEGCQACVSDAQCDDGNICTQDECVGAHPEGQQDAAYMTDGFHHPSSYCTYKSMCTPCAADEDCLLASEPCSGEAYCDMDSGYCEFAGTDCDDNDPCTVDLCSPESGQCIHDPLADCCQQDTDCVDFDPCTGRYCDLETLSCQFPDYVCDDWDPCTADACDGDGQCTHLALPGCDKVCWTDLDCRYNQVQPDLCLQPKCILDAQQNVCVFDDLMCEDLRPCTFNLCVEEIGCQYLPDPDCQAPCDGPDDPACQVDSPCYTGFCDPDTGLCKVEPIGCDVGEACVSNDQCDDEDLCTLDRCALNAQGQAVCIHHQADCTDGNPCTLDSCNPATGCFFQPLDECFGCQDPGDCLLGTECLLPACSSGHKCSYTNLCF